MEIKDHSSRRFIHDGAFTRMLSLPFGHVHGRATSALLLCASTYFLLPQLRLSVQRAFALSDYAVVFQNAFPFALFLLSLLAFAHLERLPLTPRTLGLSFDMPRERRNSVLLYVGIMVLGGLCIALFLGYFKQMGVPIHRISTYIGQEASPLHAIAGAGAGRTFLLDILPHSIGVLVLAPIIEEVYITGVVFPALRNKMGFVAGAGIAASAFALFHASANPFTGGQWLPFAIIAVGQVASFTLYQGTRSLYPSIASHALRNFAVLFVELSALVG